MREEGATRPRYLFDFSKFLINILNRDIVKYEMDSIFHVLDHKERVRDKGGRNGRTSSGSMKRRFALVSVRML